MTATNGLHALWAWLLSFFGREPEGPTIQGGFFAQALLKAGYVASEDWPRPRPPIVRRARR